MESDSTRRIRPFSAKRRKKGNRTGKPAHLAMGQNPNRTPGEHPDSPTKIGSKMGGECTYQPKWDPKTVLTTTAIYHFGIGAPPILVYFRGAGDVHWGLTGVLTTTAISSSESNFERSRLGAKEVDLHRGERFLGATASARQGGRGGVTSIWLRPLEEVNIFAVVINSF